MTFDEHLIRASPGVNSTQQFELSGGQYYFYYHIEFNPCFPNLQQLEYRVCSRPTTFGPQLGRSNALPPLSQHDRLSTRAIESRKTQISVVEAFRGRCYHLHPMSRQEGDHERLKCQFTPSFTSHSHCLRLNYQQDVSCVAELDDPICGHLLDMGAKTFQGSLSRQLTKTGHVRLFYYTQAIVPLLFHLI